MYRVGRNRSHRTERNGEEEYVNGGCNEVEGSKEMRHHGAPVLSVGVVSWRFGDLKSQA